MRSRSTSFPRCLDIRTKLLFATACGGMALFPSSPAAVTLSLLLALPFLGIQGQWPHMGALTLGTAAAWGGYRLLLTNSSVPLVLMAYGCFFILKTLPLVCLCASVATTTRLSELFALLGKTRLPSSLILAIAVTCRFIPTLDGEYGRIREAMRVRGIRGGVMAFATRPIRQVEYILLPLATRATRLADELAASAMTRGIESPVRREYALSPLRPADTGLMAWLILLAAAFAFISTGGIIDA